MDEVDLNAPEEQQNFSVVEEGQLSHKSTGCVDDMLSKSGSSVHDETQVPSRESTNDVDDEVKTNTTPSEPAKPSDVSQGPSTHFDEPKTNMEEQSLVSPTNEPTNNAIPTVNTPVCYLVYEEVANGSFYLQWKPNSDNVPHTAVLVFIPTKTVPKFKTTVDGGRSLFSTKVVPDKNNFYSCICQFLKLAKDYKSKFQLLTPWDSILPYKSDLYLHYEDNKVVKVETGTFSLDDVNQVAIVGKSISFTIRMSKEQFSANTRNAGYALTI